MATFRAFSTTPAIAGVGHTDGSSVNVGVEFWATSAATVTEIRWLVPTSDAGTTDREVSLWDTVSGTNVSGPHTLAVATAGTWAVLTLPVPYPLVVGRRYKAVVRHPAGCGYSATSLYFDTGAGGPGIVSGPLYIPGAGEATGNNQGTFSYSASNVQPTSGSASPNYWIDVTLSNSELAVSAGTDQAIYTTQTASLTASATGGSGTKSYTWTKVSGPAGTFSAPSSASTTFTPTGGAGVYVLRALVTDSSGTGQDDVTVTVTAAPTLVSYDSITSSTGWTPTGGTVLAVISDSSDSTLITSSDNPVNVLLDGYLPAITAPGSGQNFVTRVRCDRPGASSGAITGRLYEGSTLRSTVVVNVPSSLGDVDISFPAADLAPITPTAWSAVVTGTRTAMRVTLSATAAV